MPINEEELEIETPVNEPPRILVYSGEGMGKSTFAAGAPNPIFLPTEKGLTGLMNVKRFPIIKSYSEMMGRIQELAEKKHDRQTAVIDSLDWFEPMVWEQVMKTFPYTEKGKKIESIEDYGYGRGYAEAIPFWKDYLDALDFLREERGMTIIQICHSQVSKFEDPLQDTYDKYTIKLQDSKKVSAAGKLLEYSDMVLFIKDSIGLKTSKEGFNRERKRAVGEGDRFLYTEQRPGFSAKNRYSLPAEIPFTKDGAYWGVIAEHVPFFNQPAEETNG